MHQPHSSRLVDCFAAVALSALQSADFVAGQSSPSKLADAAGTLPQLQNANIAALSGCGVADSGGVFDQLRGVRLLMADAYGRRLLFSGYRLDLHGR